MTALLTLLFLDIVAPLADNYLPRYIALEPLGATSTVNLLLAKVFICATIFNFWYYDKIRQADSAGSSTYSVEGAYSGIREFDLDAQAPTDQTYAQGNFILRRYIDSLDNYGMNSSDTNSSDTNSSDTNSSDTNSSDTNSSDTNGFDRYDGCSDSSATTLVPWQDDDIPQPDGRGAAVYHSPHTLVLVRSIWTCQTQYSFFDVRCFLILFEELILLVLASLLELVSGHAVTDNHTDSEDAGPDEDMWWIPTMSKDDGEDSETSSSSEAIDGSLGRGRNWEHDEGYYADDEAEDEPTESDAHPTPDLRPATDLPTSPADQTDVKVKNEEGEQEEQSEPEASHAQIKQEPNSDSIKDENETEDRKETNDNDDIKEETAGTGTGTDIGAVDFEEYRLNPRIPPTNETIYGRAYPRRRNAWDWTNIPKWFIYER